MDKYTIYCTEEQTKTALELGAPITKERIGKCITERLARLGYLGEENEYDYLIPTAEQMIAWLEDKLEFTTWHVNFYPVYELYGFLIIHKEGIIEHDASEGGIYLYNSRREAILAAIDAALDYLIKAKEEKR